MTTYLPGEYVPENEEEREFLASYDPSKYPIITVSVDAVVTSGDHILLIRRNGFPYRNRLALPGGFIDPQENAREAIRREVSEECGTEIDLGQFIAISVADNPNRDPRGRCISIVHRAVLPEQVKVTAGDDAASVQWFPIDKILELPDDEFAFDHKQIIDFTLEK